MLRYIRNFILIAGILVSLFALVQLYSIISLLLLVPWDVSFVRPDVGTWQRTLNDFFESRPGELFTYSFYTIFFASITVYTLIKRWSSALRLMVINLIAAFGLFPLVRLSIPLSQFIFPYPADYNDPFYFNYKQSFLPMVLMVVMLGWWLREIRHLQSPMMKAKNKASQASRAEELALQNLSEAENDASYDELVNGEKRRLTSS